LELTNLTVAKTGDKVRASIDVDGRELYFLFDGVDQLYAPGDMMLLACLVSAMIEGDTLTIRDDRCTVSARLIQNLDHFQVVFCQWYDGLSPVKIVAPTVERDRNGAGCGCLFSGGVDSVYSFVRHLDEITHLVFCHGFDIRLNETDRFQQAVALNRRIASLYDKTLVVFETNIREALPNFHTIAAHGTLLVGPALALGLRKLYVPASFTYKDLEHSGSHPLTDQLLSNEATSVVHDTAMRRVDKIAFLGDHQEALDILRVCASEDAYNCGKCEKCLRTIVALELLALKSKSLPPLSEAMADLKRLKLYSERDYTFWYENYQLAQRRNHVALTKITRDICRSFMTRRYLKRLYEMHFGDQIYEK
jgi:hypothetical protein